MIAKRREKRKLVPVKLIDFLNGAAPLDGAWYGEAPPRGMHSFWWREYFRATRCPRRTDR